MSESEFENKDVPQPEPEGEAAAEPAKTAPEPPPEAAAGQALVKALNFAFLFLKAVMVALLVTYVFVKGFFTVDQDELKMKLRFGAVVGRTGEQRVLEPESGVHFRWPWEKVERLNTDEQVLDLADDFWPNIVETQRLAGGLDIRRGDGYLVTGDVNIIHLKLRARYRVSGETYDALAYKFQVDEPENILRRALRAATTKVVGSMTVEDVLQRKDLFARIEAELRRRIEQFRDRASVPLGLELVRVEAMEAGERLKNPSEPRAASEAFYNAQMAADRKDKLVEEGNAEARTIMQLAQAAHTRVVESARADAVRLIEAARADADRLKAIQRTYEASEAVGELFRQMYHQWNLEQIMTHVRTAYVLYESAEGSKREIRIDISPSPTATQPRPPAGP